MENTQSQFDSRLLLPRRPQSSGDLLRAVVGPHWFLTLVAILLLGIAALVHMAVPWFLARIIDEGLMEQDSGALVYWGLALAIVSLFNPLSYALGYRIMALLEANTRRRVNHTVNHYVSYSTESRGIPRTGETVNVVTNDNETLASIFSTIGHGVMNVIAFTIGVILVWNIHMWLGISIAIGVLATTVIAGPLLGKLENRWNQYRQSLSSTTDIAADTIRGLRVLRGIGGEQKFLERYRKQSRMLQADSYELSNHSSWIHALQQVIPLIYMVVIIWLGARLAYNGDITVGELGAAFGYATGLVMYSGSLLGIAHSVVSIRVATSRITHQLSGVPSNSTDTVNKHHDNSKKIVVEHGKLTVVIPGQTHHMKQAFSDLVDDGNRHDRLFVSDEDYIFSGALFEALNIEIDKVDATLSVVNGTDIRSSVEADSHRIIQDKGLNLSGGQRQRLTLARAVSRDPKTLLLCDPTTAVDAATELAIAKRLKTIRTENTTVVATRSLIWQSYADTIIDLRECDKPVTIELKSDADLVPSHFNQEHEYLD